MSRWFSDGFLESMAWLLELSLQFTSPGTTSQLPKKNIQKSKDGFKTGILFTSQ